MSEIEDRIVSAALDRKDPFQSPESIIAGVLAQSLPGDIGYTPKIARKRAHQIADALRAAGWRILR